MQHRGRWSKKRDLPNDFDDIERLTRVAAIHQNVAMDSDRMLRI
jgi:hypothetical protein